jgi:hypothetical protein
MTDTPNRVVDFPDFPVRDLKYMAITKLAHHDWKIHKPKNASLELVSKSFRANTARIRLLMLLPTHIAGTVEEVHVARAFAEYDVTGELSREDLPPDIFSKVNDHHIGILRIDRAEKLKKKGTPEWDKIVGEFHFAAVETVEGITTSPLGAYGFVPLFSAFITGVWTAIESMSGDLWEAALNSHPTILAALRGKARIGGPNKSAYPAQRGGGPDSKSVPLDMIELHKFDVRTSMGTIFRRQRRFEFTRLSGIREAYSCAFSEKSSKIDAALASKSLDALSAVRNVLVHKAGLADAEYVRLSSSFDVPKTELGSPVLLDGEVVAKLVKGAVTSANSLLIAVDDWTRQN